MEQICCGIGIDRQRLFFYLPGFKVVGKAVFDCVYTYEFTWTFIIHEGIVIRGLLYGPMFQG